jgi:hypothetical protein
MSRTEMFTASSIDALEDGAIHDPQTLGLSIVAKKGGRKLWRYRRRVVGDGKILDIHLGTYPAHSIGAAREWASGLNAKMEPEWIPAWRREKKKSGGA